MQRFALPNGLTVLFVEAPHLHHAAFALGVRAGPRYETQPTNGLSHFLEHMLFRGPRGLSGLEFMRALDRLAVDSNADTYRDALVVHGACPIGALEATLALFAQAIIDPNLDPADIELERQVIVEEVLDDLDEDGDVIECDTLAKRAMWPSHPLGMPLGGTLDHVREFGVADLRSWHDRCFVGSNAVLAIVAPVLPVAVVHFTALPDGSRLVSLPPPSSPPSAIVQYNSGSQISATLSWQVPGGSAAHELLPFLLTHGYSSRLRHALVEASGLVYGVDVTYEDFGDAGAFEVAFDCAPSKLLTVTQAVADVLTCYQPTPGELDIARAQYRLQHAIMLDRASHLAVELVSHDLLGAHALEAESRAVAELTSGGICAAVAALGQPHVTLVGPIRGTPIA